MARLNSLYSTSSELVYDEIRSQIVSRELCPGDRLPEMKIAVDMNVSRTPVREALRRLSSEGLVQIKPNSGARVVSPSAEEVSSAYVVRETLEALSVRLACKNGLDDTTVRRIELALCEEKEAFDRGDAEASIAANGLFHKLIANASKNPLLYEYIENVTLRTNTYILFYSSLDQEKDFRLAEHRAIYRAILERDEVQADKLIKEHLHHAYSVLASPHAIKPIKNTSKGKER